MRVRSIRLFLIAVILASLGVYTGVVYSAYSLQGYDVVAENEVLILMMNRTTTEIAVVDKATGQIWYSNPPGGKSQREQLSITYWDPEDKVRSLNSYSDAVEYGQFEITEIDGGVKVRYVLGQEWTDDNYVPKMVSQSRFEDRILGSIESSSDRSFMLKQYVLIELIDTEQGDVSEEIKKLDGSEKIMGRYVLVSPSETLSSNDRKTLSAHLLDVVSQLRKDINTAKDVKPEDISQLVGNPTYVIRPKVRPWDMKKIVTSLKAIGYTPLDAGADHRENNLDAPERNVETFTLAIEYRLDGDTLVVRVPMSEVEYPKDVIPQKTYKLRGTDTDRPWIAENFDAIGGKEVTYPIRTIEVLKYFGAAESRPDGYIFVPDGSGALISIDRPRGLNYSRRIYGVDYTDQGGVPGQNVPESLRLQNYIKREQVYLPVFGMKEGDKAFCAIVEGGAAFGQIRAEGATGANKFHSVFTDYKVTSVSNITLMKTTRSLRGGGKSISVYSEGLPDEDIVIRFRFLIGDDAGYVGMARYYRSYLEEKCGLQRLDEGEDIPFFMELIGATWKKRLFMGIPLISAEPMTDFNEVKEIVDAVLDAGVRNIKVRYSGWQKGGLKNGPPMVTDVEASLGSPQAFSDLQGYLKGKGVEFFPDVDFVSLYENGSRGVDFRLVVSQSVNEAAVSITEESTGLVKYAISPSALGLMLDTFLSGYARYGIDGISLRGLGRQVNPDYRAGSPIDREKAVDIIEQQLGRLGSVDDDAKVLVEGCNAYALPFAEYIVDMPLEASAYDLIEPVPFYQIALHGLKAYAGPPANLVGDYRRYVLKCIETGASPNFMWTYEDPSEVKGTNFDYLYSTGYRTWLDEAVAFYQEANSALKGVRGQRIVDHQWIQEDVYRTDYENGVSIFVNYNTEAVQVGDINIDAESYRVTQRGVQNEF
jgi:hypothetical protein